MRRHGADHAPAVLLAYPLQRRQRLRASTHLPVWTKGALLTTDSTHTELIQLPRDRQKPGEHIVRLDASASHGPAVPHPGNPDTLIHSPGF